MIRIVKSFWVITFVLVFNSLFFSCNISKNIITTETLLNEMVNREEQSRYPKVDFRLKQQSSYNRASVSSADSVGWFNNHDFNSNDKDHNFIRIEEKNQQKEWVLMEHFGAGAIVRTWMPFLSDHKSDTDIQIKIYLDGNEEPVLEGNMLDLLNGDGLFPYPFAHKSLRSAVSFYPILYAKSCKITTTGRPFFYQFTYREYPKGTKIKTFSKEDFENAKRLNSVVGEKLLNPISGVGNQSVKVKVSVPSSEEKIVELPKGYLAVSGSKFDKQNKANITMREYISFLLNFWNEVDRIYNGRSVVIPVFGSGILRFTDGYSKATQQDLLEIILWTFKVSRIKITYPSKIEIVILSDKKTKYNLYKLKEITKNGL